MTSPSVVASTALNCLRYWALADSLKIDMIVALWCGIEPSDIAKFKRERLSTHCTDAKRAAIEDALYSGRLDYIDEDIPYGDSENFVGIGVPQLAQKDRLRVKRA